MGRTLVDVIAKDEGFEVVAGVDKFATPTDFDVPLYSDFAHCVTECDVILDFSRAEAVYDILPYALQHRLPVVLATTGHSEEEMQYIRETARTIPVFKTSNMSLGVNLLINLSKQAARFLGTAYDVEIIEYHHNQKVDSPSGTALSIAEAISEEFVDGKELVYGRHSKCEKRTPAQLGIHAVRGGTIVGKHDVMYIGTSEIVTLSHQAESRQVFCFGALRAAVFLLTKQNGLFNMNDIIGQDYSVTTVQSHAAVELITVRSTEVDEFTALLGDIADEEINLDMISQTLEGATAATISFTVESKRFDDVMNIIEGRKMAADTKRNVATLLVEGAGMEHQYGVANQVLKILRDAGISIYAITTSETNITCCIDRNKVAVGEAALRKYYGI